MYNILVEKPEWKSQLRTHWEVDIKSDFMKLGLEFVYRINLAQGWYLLTI